jgi:hypothetical protein
VAGKTASWKSMLCTLSETEYSYELLFPEIMQKEVQNWYLGVLMYVVDGQNIP